MDEGNGRVGQSGDGVMSESRIPELVRSGAPVEIEQEIWLGSNLPKCYQGGTVG